jgi:hypothetical protein
MVHAKLHVKHSQDIGCTFVAPRYIAVLTKERLRTEDTGASAKGWFAFTRQLGGDELKEVAAIHTSSREELPVR